MSPLNAQLPIVRFFLYLKCGFIVTVFLFSNYQHILSPVRPFKIVNAEQTFLWEGNTWVPDVPSQFYWKVQSLLLLSCIENSHLVSSRTSQPLTLLQGCSWWGGPFSVVPGDLTIPLQGQTRCSLRPEVSWCQERSDSMRQYREWDG